jgi:DNA ligase-1
VLSRRILKDNPAAFITFDILYLDGRLLMDQSLRERRAALNCLAECSRQRGRSFLTTDVTEVTTAEQISAAFDAARNRRNEGIVLKDPESAYSPGRRGQWWLKLKTHLPTFDCVVTAAEYGHGKRRNVLSDYTFAVWDREPSLPGAALVNVGKAYSGCTDEEIAQLTEMFLQLSRAQYGRVHVVEPTVVLEIACDQIQKSARHASGYALRFPRIKRIRSDKRPQDADQLRRIIEIYESSPNFARPVTAPAPEVPEPSLFD